MNFSGELSCCIVSILSSLDEMISTLLVVFCLFMYEIPYHVHFVNSNLPTGVLSIWLQLLAAIWRLSHVCFSKLLSQSLAYYLLLSTSPMVSFTHDWVILGDVMLKTLYGFPIISIIWILLKNHIVPVHPHPHPYPVLCSRYAGVLQYNLSGTPKEVLAYYFVWCSVKDKSLYNWFGTQFFTIKYCMLRYLSIKTYCYIVL